MKVIHFRDGENIGIPREALHQLIRYIVDREPFDENWYLATYPDVKAAVENGEILSAKAHYVDYGYFENRLPGLTGFDAMKYLELNPDLASLGPEDATVHFIAAGYAEGRSF